MHRSSQLPHSHNMRLRRVLALSWITVYDDCSDECSLAARPRAGPAVNQTVGTFAGCGSKLPRPKAQASFASGDKSPLASWRYRIAC
jgi:hypothetical protein